MSEKFTYTFLCAGKPPAQKKSLQNIFYDWEESHLQQCLVALSFLWLYHEKSLGNVPFRFFKGLFKGTIAQESSQKMFSAFCLLNANANRHLLDMEVNGVSICAGLKEALGFRQGCHKSFCTFFAYCRVCLIFAIFGMFLARIVSS